ncbi:hypothetical protein ABPG75_011645 [Micractinium tetrahymenae]
MWTRRAGQKPVQVRASRCIACAARRRRHPYLSVTARLSPHFSSSFRHEVLTSAALGLREARALGFALAHLVSVAQPSSKNMNRMACGPRAAALPAASRPAAVNCRQRVPQCTLRQPRAAIRRPGRHPRVLTVTALPAAASAAALLPDTVAAASGSGITLSAAFGHLLQSVDPHVAGATVGASAKLAMVCALVGWLLKTGQLPASTASVLSRVSFTLLIPAMLFTKVAATLAARPDPYVLASISLVTLLQVGAGALLAELVAPAVDRLMGAPLQGAQPVAGAAGTAGVAAGAGGLSETGLRRLVTLASSFGSSFTLPVVFFTQMLPAAEAERALGFTALILLSWSPLMWSLGLGIVRPRRGGSTGEGGATSAAAAGAGEAAAVDAAAALAEPPVAAAGTSLASAWRGVAAFGRQVLTPPFLAILAGMLAGLTPWGRALVGAGSAAAASTATSGAAAPQAAIARAGAAVLRSAMDVLKMLAGGTLAAQTVVLAASLLQKPEGQEQEQQQQPGGGRRGPLAGLRALLLPANGAEARALATVAITRFLLLPSLTAGAVWGLGRAGLLPAVVASDPVLLLVLLVEAVMPSAQNLIVLCSLSASTAGLAPLLASLLVKLYALSILPVSAWVSCWVTWLGVAVA